MLEFQITTWQPSRKDGIRQWLLYLSDSETAILPPKGNLAIYRDIFLGDYCNEGLLMAHHNIQKATYKQELSVKEGIFYEMLR